MSTLFERFSYDFFVHGMEAAVMAGALCGLIGVFITLRGMSYIGHGLSHSVFGGFAAATTAGINPLLGAGVWGLLSALAITSVTRRSRIGADAAIGVITTASFALGVALLTKFGSLAGVRRATREELEQVVGANVARAVIDYFAQTSR